MLPGKCDVDSLSVGIGFLVSICGGGVGGEVREEGTLFFAGDLVGEPLLLSRRVMDVLVVVVVVVVVFVGSVF